MTLYNNRYRIESARFQKWDYASNGYYYITINTKNNIPYFGKVVHGEMILSEIGKIADRFWREIPDHFPFVQLDEFVIMPTHMHGIIVIKNTPPGIARTEGPRSGRSMWKPGIIGVIINQYKRMCTIKTRKIKRDFGWHSRFYDHIIRDNKDLKRIQKYIRDNPRNWKK